MYRFNSFWSFTFSILIIFVFVFVPLSPALAGGGDLFSTLLTVAIVVAAVYIGVGFAVPIDPATAVAITEAGGSAFWVGATELTVGGAGTALGAAGYTGFATTISTGSLLTFGATAGALAGMTSSYQQAPVIPNGVCYSPINSCGQAYQGTWTASERNENYGARYTYDEDGSRVNRVRRDEDGSIIPARTSPEPTCSAPTFAPPESSCPAPVILAPSEIATGNPTSSCQNQEYPTPGNYQFTVPEGISSIQAKIVGGGGGGGGSYMDGDAHGGAGGGSGGYRYDAMSVSPGQTLNVSVGTGGCGGHYWYFGSDYGGGCSYTTWAGVNGTGSSVDSLTATGGHGGAAAIIGGNDGAGGTPNGKNGTNGRTFSCTGGTGGDNGSGYGKGGSVRGCTGGDNGGDGYVRVEWACDTTTPTPPPPVCVRDGVCSANETASSCPSDCADIPVVIEDPNPDTIKSIKGGFTAAPNPLLYNNRTTLSWNATGATTCTIVGIGGITGTETDRYILGATGSQASSKLKEDTNFTLSCSNNRRGSDSKTITVKVYSPEFEEF